MVKKSFPISPCHVCNRKIENLEGAVFCDNYAPWLPEIKKAGREQFVNALTYQYFRQHQIIFQPVKHDESYPGKYKPVDFAGMMQDSIINAQAPQWRYETVIKKWDESKGQGYPELAKFLFVLAHDECVPAEFSATYFIDLSRIQTVAAEREWLIHLNEKVWFHFEGWRHIMTDLHGRSGVA